MWYNDRIMKEVRAEGLCKARFTRLLCLNGRSSRRLRGLKLLVDLVVVLAEASQLAEAARIEIYKL